MKRLGGIQMRGTRVHKLRKQDLIEEELDREMHEALSAKARLPGEPWLEKLYSSQEPSF